MKNRPQIALATAVALILAAAAAALGYALRPAAVPDDLVAPSPARTAPVSTEDFTDERPVQVRLTVGPVVQLSAAGSGVLTATHCAPGQPVRSGTILATINYDPIYAIHTESPLYRDLEVGARGEDVRVLQRELTRLGFEVEQSAYFGWDTARALRAMKLAAGGADDDRAYTLAQSQLVWLKEAEVTAQECPASVGQSVGNGSALVTAPGELAGAQIDPLPVDLLAGERKLVILGIEGPIGADGHATDVTLLQAIAQSPQARPAIASPATVTVPAALALTAAIPVLKVPPAAVFGIDGDHGCVLANDTVHPVSIVGASLGSSLISLIEPASIHTVEVGGDLSGRPCPPPGEPDE